MHKNSKTSKTPRRVFLAQTSKVAIGMVGLTMGSTLQGYSKKDTDVDQKIATTQHELFIPELIDTKLTKRAKLTLQKGQHEFYKGIPSTTMGFNGNYLGPTVRLYKGHTAHLSFINNIGEPVSVHGHGLHVEGEVDGGPQTSFDANKTWNVALPIVQEAGTSWYHPHAMGKTAEHVHAGLAGFYYIEDDNSQTLPLPKTYGVDDIPLIVQDRSFNQGAMKPYAVNEDTMMEGLKEQVLVVNGGINNFKKVPKGWVRLRLLNGSNARFYEFSFAKRYSFYKIATEGGFLEEPVRLRKMIMAPGERNEIMINMSSLSDATLLARFLPESPNDELFYERWLSETQVVVQLIADASQSGKGTLPEKLNTIAWLNASDATMVRDMNLQMEYAGMVDMHTMFAINGAPMSMNKINEKVKLGAVELWNIDGDEMAHPFHVHGCSFLILTQNGQAPAPEDRGWKDTVIADGQAQIIMRFNHKAPKAFPYMYHCHILEHEDGGMMGQFTVT